MIRLWLLHARSNKEAAPPSARETRPPSSATKGYMTAKTTCSGCGVDLPAQKKKWCSERCRKQACYSGICEVCGGHTYSGSTTPPPICSDCFIAAIRKTPEQIREQQRLTMKRYGREKPHVVAEVNRRYREKNRDKRRAYDALHAAIHREEIIRPTACESCGRRPIGTIHGHHADYTKPLEVRWLCELCHRRLHIEHGSLAS